MKRLLDVSLVIDAINKRLGTLANWMILIACVISAANAMIALRVRHLVATPGSRSSGTCSPAWSCWARRTRCSATSTCASTSSTRMLSERGKEWLDLLGTAIFLIPSCLIIGWLSWPFFYESWHIQEISGNAGGLIRWPVKLLVPLGFALLALQGRLGDHQARGGAARLHALRNALRKTGAMIPLEWMPPLMFGGLIVIMLIGYPVAFSLAALGLIFGALCIYLGFFDFGFLQAIPGRIFGSILANELLLAIPFFTFMGAILEKCGLAEDMLDSMGQLFGTLRGGIGYSVIIVGFILGAITGTVAAQVIAMALISLPVMMRYKYNMRYATGVLAASGTITQLVPPSLVLVVLADQLGRSVGDMYLGAWGPSLLQVTLFMLFTFADQHRQAALGPGDPEDRPHAARLGAVAEVPVGHHSRRGADLPRARHAAHGLRDADRRRRHGHRSAPSCWR